MATFYQKPFIYLPKKKYYEDGSTPPTPPTPTTDDRMAIVRITENDGGPHSNNTVYSSVVKTSVLSGVTYQDTSTTYKLERLPTNVYYLTYLGPYVTADLENTLKQLYFTNLDCFATVDTRLVIFDATVSTNITLYASTTLFQSMQRNSVSVSGTRPRGGTLTTSVRELDTSTITSLVNRINSMWIRGAGYDGVYLIGHNGGATNDEVLAMANLERASRTANRYHDFTSVVNVT